MPSHIAVGALALAAPAITEASIASAIAEVFTAARPYVVVWR
jgi:hypothetical protein